MIRTVIRITTIGVCALALSGCISLLPRTKPAQLYRFGAAPAVAGAPVPAGTVGVFRANGMFQGESSGDRILTISGGKAAYIAQARWVSTASSLFDEALLNAFDADPGKAQLVSRGEQAKSDFVLRVDVRNFETRYDAGPGAAPTVLIRLRATLTRTDRSGLGETILEARVPSRDNRVGAIVDAYDKALAEVLGKLVAWTNQTVG